MTKCRAGFANGSDLLSDLVFTLTSVDSEDLSVFSGKDSKIVEKPLSMRGTIYSGPQKSESTPIFPLFDESCLL